MWCHWRTYEMVPHVMPVPLERASPEMAGRSSAQRPWMALAAPISLSFVCQSKWLRRMSMLTRLLTYSIERSNCSLKSSSF